MADINQINLIEEIIGYRFSDTELLKRALTHASVSQDKSYERLEFLGDRVLSLTMAHLLYDAFPDENEGDLAKRHAALVQRKTLYTVAKELKISTHVLLSNNEAETGGRKKEAILADIIESLLGAVYLEGGYDKASTIVKTLFEHHVHAFKAPPQDSKTRLQEYAQKLSRPLPTYKVVNQTGPSHAPEFEIEVFVEGLPTRRAKDKSKQKAQKRAADLLLKEIDK